MTVHDAPSGLPGDATTPAAPEQPPEKLPAKAWVTLILFAAFVVGGSSCIVNLLLR